MSAMSQVVGLPGMRAARTVLSRMITRGGWIPSILPQGRVISGISSSDPTNAPQVFELQAGLLMGKIATPVNGMGIAGQYAPSIIGAITVALGAAGTVVTAPAAVISEIIRRFGPTGNVNITGPAAANTPPLSTNVLAYTGFTATTLTIAAPGKAFVAGSLLQPNDGSQTPITFLPSGTPIRVQDYFGNYLDVPFAEIPVDGIVDAQMLLPVWPADVTLQQYIMNSLSNAYGGKFQFDQAY